MADDPQQPGWGQPPQQSGWVDPYGSPTQGGYAPPPYGLAPTYAGFWIRFAAAFLDGLIVLVLMIGLIITIIGILAVPFVYFGYRPYLWWKQGATFGQSALGLRVVRAIDGGPVDGGTACVRALVWWFEALGGYILVGIIGFVWAAFEPRKRAWHDMAAGTVVIQTH